MPPSIETDQIDDAATTAAQADAASPAGTDAGAASSAAAVEERSSAEMLAEAFQKEFGDPTKDEAPAPAPEPQPEEDAPATARQDGAEEPKGKARLSDEQWKALPPEARHRIGYLTEQARAAKTATQEVERYRADSEALGHLRRFTDEHNMSGQDVSNALTLGSLLSQGRYAEFLDAIEPIYRRAAQAAGREFDPALRQQVDDGEITPEAAKRLTQAEIGRQQAEADARREREQRTTREQQERDERHAQAVVSRVQAELATLRASDPEYAQKEAAIGAMWRTLVENGFRPETPEKAAAALRQIHQQVVLPKPALRPTPPNPGASTTPQRSPAPRTTLEAIQAAWNR